MNLRTERSEPFPFRSGCIAPKALHRSQSAPSDNGHRTESTRYRATTYRTRSGPRRGNVRTTDKTARGSRTIDDHAKGRDTQAPDRPAGSTADLRSRFFPRISDQRPYITNVFAKNNAEAHQRGVSRKKASVCRPCPKAIGAEHKDATAMRITT